MLGGIYLGIFVEVYKSIAWEVSYKISEGNHERIARVTSKQISNKITEEISWGNPEDFVEGIPKKISREIPN